MLLQIFIYNTELTSVNIYYHLKKIIVYSWLSVDASSLGVTIAPGQANLEALADVLLSQAFHSTLSQP